MNIQNEVQKGVIKKILAVTSLALLFASNIFSQSAIPSVRRYLEFHCQGQLRNDTTRQNNVTTITQRIAGGFISFGALTDYYAFPVRVEATLFPKGTVNGKNQVIDSLQSKIKPYEALDMFLNIGQEFRVDVFEPGTDSLLLRYQIIRDKVYPQIWLLQNQKGMMHLFDVPNTGENNEMNVKPDLPISFSQHEPINQNNPEVEYTFTDLSTNEKKQYIGKEFFDLPALQKGKEYELKYNYKLQPSSVVTIRISAKDPSASSILFFGIIGLSLLITIVLILLLISWRKNKLSTKQRHKLEDAAISLQTSLNPHFTFNSLSTIQGLINTGKIDDANEYLQEFGSLLRKTLTKSQQVYNTLDQELEMMRHYLRIEALRFKFKWNIVVAPGIPTSQIEIPTLILQPIIENSVKHGVALLKESGVVEIFCETSEQPGSFVIMVKDNGIWQEPESKEGFGLSLTRKRISTINQLRKDSRVQISIDKTNGTSIRFLFQNWI